jgi:hypothetical protein
MNSDIFLSINETTRSSDARFRKKKKTFIEWMDKIA